MEKEQFNLHVKRLRRSQDTYLNFSKTKLKPKNSFSSRLHVKSLVKLLQFEKDAIEKYIYL